MPPGPARAPSVAVLDSAALDLARDADDLGLGSPGTGESMRLSAAANGHGAGALGDRLGVPRSFRRASTKRTCPA